VDLHRNCRACKNCGGCRGYGCGESSQTFVRRVQPSISSKLLDFGNHGLGFSWTTPLVSFQSDPAYFSTLSERFDDMHCCLVQATATNHGLMLLKVNSSSGKGESRHPKHLTKPYPAELHMWPVLDLSSLQNVVDSFVGKVYQRRRLARQVTEGNRELV
jgi:hypothetical protein